MKKNAIFGLLAIVLVFGSVGCATVEYAFTPTENLKDPGFIMIGDSVGSFKCVGAYESYEWKFVLVRGEGDTDNDLFEIRNDNILVAKGNLSPRNYSIRVNILGKNQQDTGGSGGTIYTFTVTEEAPIPPRPVYGDKDAKTTLEGMWTDVIMVDYFYEFTGNVWRLSNDLYQEMGTFSINGSRVTFTFIEYSEDGGQTWKDIKKSEETKDFTFENNGNSLQIGTAWYRKK